MKTPFIALATMAGTLLGAAAAQDAAWPPAGVTVLTPDSDGFEDATARWNGYKGPTFDEAVVPANAADVAKIVSRKLLGLQS
jgi:hypothetical protein